MTSGTASTSTCYPAANHTSSPSFYYQHPQMVLAAQQLNGTMAYFPSNMGNVGLEPVPTSSSCYTPAATANGVDQLGFDTKSNLCVYGQQQSTSSGEWTLSDVPARATALQDTSAVAGDSSSPTNHTPKSKKRRKLHSNVDESLEDNEEEEDDKNALAVYPWMTRVHSGADSWKLCQGNTKLRRENLLQSLRLSVSY